MKQLAILFLSLILYISIASAKQKTNNVSLKQLIQKVKNSTGDDRRMAMNTLKVKLRSMNQETRQHVMRDLQKSFAGKQNQHSRQRALQTGTSRKRTMHTGNTGSLQPPSSGGMHANPSQTPAHSSPVTVPHQPSIPSTPQMPYQPGPSLPHAPHQPGPSIPQIPHSQPPSPQMPSHQMPSPGMPSPHFGQPGGHK